MKGHAWMPQPVRPRQKPFALMRTPWLQLPIWLFREGGDAGGRSALASILRDFLSNFVRVERRNQDHENDLSRLYNQIPGINHFSRDVIAIQAFNADMH